MIFVISAIFCSASIALVFKYSETTGRNRYAVTATNYLAASIVSALIIWNAGITGFFPEKIQSSIAAILHSIISNQRFTEPSHGVVWAYLSGCCAGIIFFLAFLAYQMSVKRHGASISGAYAKIGILVPMLMSLLIWQEYPTGVQWLGISLAISAMILVNVDSFGSKQSSLKWSLFLLFLLGGLAEFSNKLYQNYGIQELKPLFLVTVFGMAFICSVVTMLWVDRRISPGDFMTGLAVGIPNLFSSYFLIQGLETVPAGVAFPVFGAGTIAVVNLGGWLIYKEQLSRLEWIAMVLIVGALVLVNL